jgi:hypothetical protein
LNWPFIDLHFERSTLPAPTHPEEMDEQGPEDRHVDSQPRVQLSSSIVPALCLNAGTTKYAYTAGGQLWTEDGPFASDTITNIYFNRMRTNLSLQQPTGAWTNAFRFDPARRLTNVTSQAGSFAWLPLPNTKNLGSLRLAGIVVK